MLEYRWQKSGSVPTGYSDSDWAGDKATGKSTTGGILMLGAYLAKSWSRTHDSVTLSSAEAEFVAMESLSTRSMCREWELTNKDQASILYADASTALSIAKRQGGWKDAPY